MCNVSPSCKNKCCPSWMIEKMRICNSIGQCPGWAYQCKDQRNNIQYCPIIEKFSQECPAPCPIKEEFSQCNVSPSCKNNCCPSWMIDQMRTCNSIGQCPGWAEKCEDQRNNIQHCPIIEKFRSRKLGMLI